MYMLAYRNLGIFQENVVNRFLRDVVEACKPVSATVIGEFTPRGGVYSKITASWSRKAWTQRLNELNSRVIQEIRDRVRARHPERSGCRATSRCRI